MLITNGYGCFLSDLMFFKQRRLLCILSIHSKNPFYGQIAPLDGSCLASLTISLQHIYVI